MKNILTSLIFIFVSLTLFAQTDGISYQAVIIGPDKQELPGVDAEGNIFPEATIAIRFTILDANNSAEYQEVQTTNTDAFGRIDLLIGSVNPDEFTKISWDGTNKDLKVEIDFSGGGSSFVDMSREQLTFVPYAYHRNITAAGTLKVDDATELNSELLVKGPAQLESVLDVSGNTDLNSDLQVKGATQLFDSLNVNKGKATNLSGSLTVEGKAAFKGETGFNSIVVDSTSNLNGQVTINVLNSSINNEDPVGDGFPGNDILTNQNDFNKYPLRIEGSYQGIAIKVQEGRGRQNNFISFWDDEKMWGRIEGLTLPQQRHDPEWLVEHAVRLTDITINAGELIVYILEATHESTIELGAALSSVTICAGVGACATAPIPSLIVSTTIDAILKWSNAAVAVANLALAFGEEAQFVGFKRVNIGVSYQSGAGDYAEWLPKQNSNEMFNAGELVGIQNGMVTKKTWGVEQIMIVSTNPIVLGNMPHPNNEKNSVKIAFMGQVPVKVIGPVIPGDYILPNELGVSGFGRAVHPENMKTRDYKKVAGVAWNVIEEMSTGLSIVNVAVGINTNDLSEIVAQQGEKLMVLQDEIGQIKARMSESNAALASLVPGYSDAIKKIPISQIEVKEEKSKDKNIVFTNEDEIIYFEISREQIEFAMTMAREQYQEMRADQEQTSKLLLGKTEISIDKSNLFELPPIKDHPFWQKIDKDPTYKEEIIQYMQANLEKAYHTHKKYAHRFTDLKIKE